MAREDSSPSSFATLPSPLTLTHTSSAITFPPVIIDVGRPVGSLYCKSWGMPSTWNTVAIRSCGVIGVDFGPSGLLALKRLGRESFVRNAPEHVVRLERERAAELERTASGLAAQLERVRGLKAS